MSASSIAPPSGVSTGAVSSTEAPSARIAPAPVKAITPQSDSPSLAITTDPEQTRKDLEVVIARLNAQMESTGRRLGFEYDPRTDRPVVSVFNRQTGELVRQIPNEVVLRVSRSIEELKGVLFDERF